MDKPSGKEKSRRRHKDSDPDRDEHHKQRDDDDKHRSRSERVLDENLSKRKERGGSEEERFDDKRVRVWDGEERGKREERRRREERFKEDKLKSQFGEAQAKEAKAEPDINPKLLLIEVSEKEKPKEPIPQVEWWDAPLLLADDICDAKIAAEKMEKITIYVEHPRPIEPPAEPAPQPLNLTKKEQKKLHTRRRLAREKLKQELIRQGLIEPPKMTLVSVYKINNLSHPQTRFKFDARENGLTGCAVISDRITVVVVEGGSRAIKRYGKLMLKRIHWAAAVQDEAVVNKCVLVWQGSVAKQSFNRFSVHECRSQAEAHRVFLDAGVHHYWDLSVNFTEE